MVPGASWIFASVLTFGILLFTAREVSLYRADQRTRNELYPYSKRRLMLRVIISLCLLTEVLLLCVLRHTLSAQRPVWFATYVLSVIVIAGVMTLLALLDLRESHVLHAQSRRRLFQEFLQEVQQGSQPPEVH